MRICSLSLSLSRDAREPTTAPLRLQYPPASVPPTFYPYPEMNVIVVVNDSLRPDQLGCYQESCPNPLGTRVETPHVDAFAREAALFENAYTEGLPTLPTRTSWLTGRYT